MSDSHSWQQSLHEFFDLRSEAVLGIPSEEDLCYIAGRDPRLWLDPNMRQDLTQSVLDMSGANRDSCILEVGCAAGFLAQLVAPCVKCYTGVDLAETPLKVARRLRLDNAVFQKANGESLPFADASFDSVFCYDVFTNFPSFEDGAPLIREMLRVVKPGCKVLVGSIPDEKRAAELPELVQAVSRNLDSRFGPIKPRPELVPRFVAPSSESKPGLFGRLFKPAPPPVATVPIAPIIVTYDFRREDFLSLGESLGAEVVIQDVHKLNPYRGYRFNAVFTRASKA